MEVQRFICAFLATHLYKIQQQLSKNKNICLFPVKNLPQYFSEFINTKNFEIPKGKGGDAQLNNKISARNIVKFKAWEIFMKINKCLFIYSFQLYLINF